jgi:proline dehydrogenase
MGLLESSIVQTLPLVPRPVMRLLASRYIAGEHLTDAIAAMRRFSDRGYPGIVDILGEDVADEAEAREVLATYRAAASAVKAEGLDSYVSVKPTHFGLRTSEDLCRKLYSDLATHCAELGLFVRVEMEDNTTTDATLRIFEALRGEHDNVGIVLQSRLYRTLADVDALAPGPLDVRIVKGIYLEPASIAHTDPGAIRAAFVDLTQKLLERGARVCLATHDDPLAEDLLQLVREHDLGPDDYELQVLMGVQEPLWKRWRTEGHQVRVYVPYGPEWRAYTQRRLRKNPDIVRHVLKQMFLPGK